jgi:alkanesulfonate monooxygenase SsuD/methylene tetrahydromethanopterin reductase-like flavin-dependent oxidoreductase (luciferase family)
MWYAAGNTTSYAMAAHKGLGVLGFSVGSIDQLAPVMEAYKKEIASADPVGAYVNDNIMVTSTAIVAEDREAAYQSALSSSIHYLQSNVYRYHDTFPRPAWVPAWPEIIPPLDRAALELSAAAGLVLGSPDDALETCRRWEAAGADQLVFGVGTTGQDEMLETIRLIGEHVIPEVDTDPEHRTSRMRDSAAIANGP